MKSIMSQNSMWCHILEQCFPNLFESLLKTKEQLFFVTLNILCRKKNTTSILASILFLCWQEYKANSIGYLWRLEVSGRLWGLLVIFLFHNETEIWVNCCSLGQTETGLKQSMWTETGDVSKSSNYTVSHSSHVMRLIYLKGASHHCTWGAFD